GRPPRRGLRGAAPAPRAPGRAPPALRGGADARAAPAGLQHGRAGNLPGRLVRRPRLPAAPALPPVLEPDAGRSGAVRPVRPPVVRPDGPGGHPAVLRGKPRRGDPVAVLARPRGRLARLLGGDVRGGLVPAAPLPPAVDPARAAQ